MRSTIKLIISIPFAVLLVVSLTIPAICVGILILIDSAIKSEEYIAKHSAHIQGANSK